MHFVATIEEGHTEYKTEKYSHVDVMEKHSVVKVENQHFDNSHCAMTYPPIITVWTKTIIVQIFMEFSNRQRQRSNCFIHSVRMCENKQDSQSGQKEANLSVARSYFNPYLNPDCRIHAGRKWKENE